MGQSGSQLEDMVNSSNCKCLIEAWIYHCFTCVNLLNP